MRRASPCGHTDNVAAVHTHSIHSNIHTIMHINARKTRKDSHTYTLIAAKRLVQPHLLRPTQPPLKGCGRYALKSSARKFRMAVVSNVDSHPSTPAQEGLATTTLVSTAPLFCHQPLPSIPPHNGTEDAAPAVKVGRVAQLVADAQLDLRVGDGREAGRRARLPPLHRRRRCLPRRRRRKAVCCADLQADGR